MDMKQRRKFLLPFISIILVISAVIVKNAQKKPGLSNKQDLNESPMILTGDFSVGDVIIFGKYEQDNDPNNGKEDILWYVLAIENGRALLISKYALDAKPYHENWRRVTWESSDLRKWLNGEFYDCAFNDSEKSRIQAIINANPDNPISRIRGGKDTNDQIFLLSIDEANRYLDTVELRKCKSTEYTKANEKYDNEYNGGSWWWLRSRGSNSRSAALVLYSGYINEVGFGVNNGGGDVRPALWLDITAL